MPNYSARFTKTNFQPTRPHADAITFQCSAFPAGSETLDSYNSEAAPGIFITQLFTGNYLTKREGYYYEWLSQDSSPLCVAMIEDIINEVVRGEIYHSAWRIKTVSLLLAEYAFLVEVYCINNPERVEVFKFRNLRNKGELAWKLRIRNHYDFAKHNILLRRSHHYNPVARIMTWNVENPETIILNEYVSRGKYIQPFSAVLSQPCIADEEMLTPLDQLLNSSYTFYGLPCDAK